MRCHVPSCAGPELSCFVMRGRFRRAVGAGLLPGCGEGRLGSCVPPSRQRAGRDVPVLRAFRGGGCARARAGVGAGAVRAPDCARETAHAPLAPAHAGGFSAPSRSLSAETPKGGPGSRLSLLSFYTIPPNVKPDWERKVKIPEIFSRNAGRRPRAPARPGAGRLFSQGLVAAVRTSVLPFPLKPAGTGVPAAGPE